MARIHAGSLASTDGLCRVWNTTSLDVDHLGAVTEPDMPAVKMDPNTLYWITDRTPHESLPAPETVHRQWFRLVAEEVGVWWSQHSTANPLGVQPNCRIEHGNKFQGLGVAG